MRHQDDPHRPSSAAPLRFLLYPTAIFAALWWGATLYLDHTTHALTMTTRGGNGQDAVIVLERDRQGHFRGTALVNQIAMPFLIDTGATMTVIPKHLAKIARLPQGSATTVRTAGGAVTAHQTVIDQFQLGPVVFAHLPAQINAHLDEVLIGMNTLRHFEMTVQEHRVVLTARARDATGGR